MKTLHIAVVGSSGSFPELIKSFSDEGFRVFVQFYPTSYGTDLFKQSYDIILIDDYTRHKNLFLEYTASSFYMSGGEKIMASCYENTTIIGFPDTRIHDVFGGGEDEISHRLTFIRWCIMKEFQTLR